MRFIKGADGSLPGIETPQIKRLSKVKERLYVMGVKILLREGRKGAVFPQSQKLKTLLNSFEKCSFVDWKVKALRVCTDRLRVGYGWRNR